MKPMLASRILCDKKVPLKLRRKFYIVVVDELVFYHLVELKFMNY